MSADRERRIGARRAGPRRRESLAALHQEGAQPCRTPSTVIESRALRALLPDFPGLAAFESGDRGDPSSLAPGEAAAIAGARATRVAEFAAGRACAHAALDRLGRRPAPLLRGADGMPQWPPAVTGSISHTQGRCVAAALSCSAADLSLGIDIERAGAVTPDLYAEILTDVEHRRFEDLDPADRKRSASVAFSLKEAFFKAQYAQTASAAAGFADVAVLPTNDGPVLRRLASRVGWDGLIWPPYAAATLTPDGYVLSAVVVRRTPPARYPDDRGR